MLGDMGSFFGGVWMGGDEETSHRVPKTGRVTRAELHPFHFQLMSDSEESRPVGVKGREAYVTRSSRDTHTQRAEKMQKRGQEK